MSAPRTPLIPHTLATLCLLAASASSSLAAAQSATAEAGTRAAAITATGTDTSTATSAVPSAETPAAHPAEHATIVFFRPKKLMGAALGFKVREGKTELGKLRNGKYFVLQVSPGVHEYTVQGETKDVLTLEPEAGQTYYVEGTLGMGVVAGRPNLAPSSAEAFEAIKAKLEQVEPIAGDDDDPT
ncbi:MAG: DUF2846 domain-containing protein [Steroidobacteraceae bacterium]|jgi:hypothetical protein|nr:DUF2846 domain-containing protein [Steroidobacteraceae bacterium]